MFDNDTALYFMILLQSKIQLVIFSLFVILILKISPFLSEKQFVVLIGFFSSYFFFGSNLQSRVTKM